jgi:methyl-accepting chemotaxis protein-1 (serine sensor receptor)
MLNNLSIKLRLLLTMGFMGVMLIVGGAMGVFGLQTTNATVQNMYTNQMPSSDAINLMLTRLLQARAALNRVAMRPTESSAEATIKRAENFYKESDDAWNKYLALPVSSEEEKQLAAEVTEKREAYLKVLNHDLTSALRGGLIDDANTILLERGSPLYQALLKSADALVGLQNKVAAAGYEESQLLYTRFRVTLHAASRSSRKMKWAA